MSSKRDKKQRRKKKKIYRNVCQKKMKSYYSTEIAFAVLKIGKNTMY